MAELTERQAAIRDFILEYQATHKKRPTYEEIGAELGIAKKTVHKHVTKLEKRGELALLYQAKAAGAQ